MHPVLFNIIQQFGRDIITSVPMVVEAGRRELETLRDPYIDKRAYWLRAGGEAERDAEEHRHFDSMTPDQQLDLAALQAAGRLESWNKAKPQHRRPWTGAWESRERMIEVEADPIKHIDHMTRRVQVRFRDQTT